VAKRLDPHVERDLHLLLAQLLLNVADVGLGLLGSWTRFLYAAFCVSPTSGVKPGESAGIGGAGGGGGGRADRF
jgi:hypothetical protein